MKTILLVDDSELLRLVNERALTRAKYSVVTASDGEEAVRVDYQKTPDLIILDMLLPKLSGPEVLRSLRKKSVTAQIPIMVLSSLPQAYENELRKEGATAYSDNPTLGPNMDSEPLIQKGEI